jgi:hypothetical protein
MLVILPQTWAQGFPAVSLQNGSATAAKHAHAPFLAVVETRTAEPAESGAEFDLSESRTRHAKRVNRNILIVTSSVLAFFVGCRLLFQWQISSRRKKSASEVKTPGVGT